VADAVPAGRIRVACSGDSFAFGDGVADEDTWCHHLSLLDPRIEAVNLGQSGYGVDQAFLRFRRDARDLELDAHLFSFIGPDLTRAGRSSFHGFAKPVFRLEGGELVLEGVPVPERGPALRRVALGWLERLRSSEFVRRGRKKLFGRRHPPMRERIERVGPVVARLFEELHRESTERGVQTVFVYLPLSSEIEEDGPWRGWVQEYFAGSPLPLVDLTDALRAAPEAEARGYYLRDEVPAGGHLSEQGNAWAAHQLYEALRPRIDRLASDGS
jgi:hypothetical protein